MDKSSSFLFSFLPLIKIVLVNLKIVQTPRLNSMQTKHISGIYFIDKGLTQTNKDIRTTVLKYTWQKYASELFSLMK